MNAFWVSLKENVRCGTKLTDVVRITAKCRTESDDISEKENMTRENGHPMNPPASLVISRRSNVQPRLQELGMGDPSRKIVELIFHKSWMNTLKPFSKIRTVFKVSNSAEVLERFERYREKMKQKAGEQFPKHPRSSVDGNELLRFYSTTMRCCQEKSVKKAQDLCKGPFCCVCQIIQFNFNKEYIKGSEFQLNKSSKELSDNTIAPTREKSVKRAVIIFRIIAGTAVHEVDGEKQWSNSTGLGEQQFSLEKFVERNPSAVLPCFVIIFS
ncbi:hypothetical protein L6164_031036 [Bauhinia variegata]|uniref:Uncharacterized protein n=1 Tax=Bauhinia variegata TaxID=167791 RepID=A0ACB9LDT0_BAUVA|nr:hypothetical protein L6164_031036 [Bauhinia variegata]